MRKGRDKAWFFGLSCSNCYRVGGDGMRQSLTQGLLKHIFCIPGFENVSLGMGQAVRLGKRNTLCSRSRMDMYFYLVLWFFIFYLLFLYLVLNFFRIAKWCWLPWVFAVGLVGKSPRVLNAEAPTTFGERWGRVGRMMAREWSVSFRVWVRERCRVPWGMRLF